MDTGVRRYDRIFFPMRRQIFHDDQVIAVGENRLSGGAIVREVA